MILSMMTMIVLSMMTMIVILMMTMMVLFMMVMTDGASTLKIYNEDIEGCTRRTSRYSWLLSSLTWVNLPWRASLGKLSSSRMMSSAA